STTPTSTTPTTPPPAAPAPAAPAPSSVTRVNHPWRWVLAALIVLGIFHFIHSDKTPPPTSSNTGGVTMSSAELVATFFSTDFTIQDVSRLYTFPPGRYVVEGSSGYYLVGDNECHSITGGSLVVEPGQIVRAFQVQQTVRIYLPSQSDPGKGRLIETLLPTEYYALREVSPTIYSFPPGRYRVEGGSEYFLVGDRTIEGCGRPIKDGFIELKPGQRLLGFGSKQQVVRIYLPPH
ncbi:MAG: hypothetical protein P4L58_05150, partial [Candidatus Pacebacteria bacterium]|nr:hypothetical protein [Candidatus Paceibacterota bacterium]